MCQDHQFFQYERVSLRLENIYGYAMGLTLSAACGPIPTQVRVLRVLLLLPTYLLYVCTLFRNLLLGRRPQKCPLT